MTTVKTFTFNPYQTNCYVCHSSGEAVIVDASCMDEAEEELLVEYIRERNLTVRHLLLTHAHFDHIFGCASLSERFNLTWSAHKGSLPWLKNAALQTGVFGAPRVRPFMPGIWLQEGDEVRFGTSTWSVLETPGHADGSISFADGANAFVLVGDVLFQHSIGRVDLPGGSLPVIMSTIFQKLLTMPDNTLIYSGHGPATTVGHERAFNPYLQ